MPFDFVWLLLLDISSDICFHITNVSNRNVKYISINKFNFISYYFLTTKSDQETVAFLQTGRRMPPRNSFTGRHKPCLRRRKKERKHISRYYHTKFVKVRNVKLKKRHMGNNPDCRFRGRVAKAVRGGKEKTEGPPRMSWHMAPKGFIPPCTSSKGEQGQMTNEARDKRKNKHAGAPRKALQTPALASLWVWPYLGLIYKI